MAKNETFRLPDTSHRVAVVGRTGSGKTQFGAWLLSLAPFDKMPYIIFDYKGDDLLAKSGAKLISIKDSPPKKAGLYIVRPHPDDIFNVERFLQKVWENGNTGLYFDEGYMVAKSKKLEMIMVQGRSLRIPVIILTQRPVWVNKFSLSEADFFAVFQLNKIDDNKTVQNYTTDFDFRDKLPPYYSRWYDVSQAKFYTLQPVPKQSIIIYNFKSKLKENIRFL